MKILLVAPERAKWRQRYHLPKLGKALFPPLGLCYVAALTPKEINGEKVEISLVDEAVSRLDLEAKVDLVALTANTPAVPRAYEIAAHFRKRGVKVVLGGMHASACPEEAKRWVDAVCIGEAEGFWPELLVDFVKGRLESEYRCSEPPDISRQPIPRRDLLNWKKYHFPKTVDAIRGCNKRCSFCSVWKFHGGRYRIRPVGEVIREIDQLQKSHPLGPLIFVADNLTANKVWFLRLCERLGPLGLEWFCQADTLALRDEALVQAAGQAGCRVMFVGLESLSEENLRDLHKNFNIRAQIKEIVARLHRHGIAMIGAFIVGLDGDTPEVFQEIVQAVQTYQIDAAQVAIWIPIPDTDDAQRLEAEGRILDRDWLNYDGNHAVFRPKKMTPWELEAGQKNCYRQLTTVKAIRERLRGQRGRHRVISWGLNLAVRRRAQKWLTEGS